MVATRAGARLTPHPHPSPRGEGLNSTSSRQFTNRHDKALLPREKGGDEGQQSLMKSRSRTLRRDSTKAESLLWQQLRSRRLQGHKFRRQVPVGNYIVDFLCEDPPIIIELDGGQHMEQQGYDQARSDWLVKNRFLVLRYWNNDVLENMQSVLENIFLSIQEPRPPITP